jgi:FkbM family methyltransferase
MTLNAVDVPIPAKTVFDVGMFDGEDSAYYLELGFHVVAVEANPAAVEAGRRRFSDALKDHRLTIENVAIGSNVGTMDLHICVEDPGSSSVLAERVHEREDRDVHISVPTMPLNLLFERYGIPYYMKVDIEGADRECILALTPDQRPPYVSFEMGDDAGELMDHLGTIGYNKFKIVSQVSFRELERLTTFGDRLVRRVRHTFRRPPRATVRRGGRWFRLEHSSGPLPELAEGRWRNLAETHERWQTHRRERADEGGWFDLHASL